ncbi:MAG: tRNA uridine-5-carboxymethylaminomethyl(34) synthesis GTPase MnmE [Coleofasciculaceae cyanobacterium RL_1_1]|nr:tRNA uridine-5-carboxymethylaminomethyl(34) synthesis GTPase MnmE [Coleofasciculaceae cyanobacterium RL_1_1]
MNAIAKDTIAAIATAIVPQQGSVGIVRVSGPKAPEIARQLFHAPGSQPWESHRILYGHIRDPRSGEIVDEALLLLMLAPRSFTREDVAEFHCHGGIIAVQHVLTLCIKAGARLAQAGEFTLRAFLNGRIDLTQAESVADLVGAQSPAAAHAALAGLQGKLANPIRTFRTTCMDALAEIEARVDFEDDLPPLNEAEICRQIDRVIAGITTIEATVGEGELLRSGLKVAIVGQPNVGKSSLLNAWSQSDRAIVTDLPGTTRDVVESQLVVGGIPIQVLDTAGIRDTTDTVERIGVDRSQAAAQQADLVLLTFDASRGWTAADREIYQRVADRTLILIANKADLLSSQTLSNPDPEIDLDLNLNLADTLKTQFPQDFPDELLTADRFILTAAAQQHGIPDLERAILSLARTQHIQAADLDIAINQRQAVALTRARVALDRVQQTINDGLPLDFWTIDLRDAIRALGEITGEEVTESVLDRIFSRFCIGK